MASQTSICNQAIRHLGSGKTIASITEASDEARACRAFYDSTLEEILAEYPWPFAKRFVTLSLVEEFDDGEWTFSYRYPTDCLYLHRLLSGSRQDSTDSKVDYVVLSDAAGRLIYTDLEDAELEYTTRATDPSLWPPLFTEAFGYKLAMKIAPSITAGDPFKLGDRATQHYVDAIDRARVNSANEQQNLTPLDAELIQARS